MYDCQKTNDAEEPICDDCGMLQPAGTPMHEIPMGNEADIWICPGCKHEMKREIAAI